MKNPIIEAIEKSIEKLPFYFNKEDKLILSEWAYSIYKDGWNNAKLLIKNKK